MNPVTLTNEVPTGLILTGGGVRAAYQVGVLQELMSMRSTGQSHKGNPFQIICGTSSGAINASVLACGADRFDDALARLVQVWGQFNVSQVYRSEILDMLRSGLGWMSLILAGWLIRYRMLRPRSLLDNSPLAELLQTQVRFDRLPQMLQNGHLSALAITASSYSGGEHVTFYQSRQEVPSWVRNQRLAMRAELSHRHLLASSAIPFIFPATALVGPYGRAWFGDGAMRQTAPISPAIHLGAEKILVIGAGRMQEPPRVTDSVRSEYPSMAKIAGHALSSIFLDALAVDIERVQRVNHTLSLIPPEQRQQAKLRPIDLLVISPSERLDDMALRHAEHLPMAVKHLLRVLGNSDPGHAQQGGAFISYLLFESPYTQELMALGRRDARAKASEIRSFFNWPEPTPKWGS